MYHYNTYIARLTPGQKKIKRKVSLKEQIHFQIARIYLCGTKYLSMPLNTCRQFAHEGKLDLK